MATKTSKKVSKKTVAKKEFDYLVKSIKDAKRILLSTHELPDGDGLGAEYALYHYLKRSRKACRIYNPDPLPKRYQFLDPKKTVLLGPNEVELWDQCDLWIILDTNDPRRLGKLWNEMLLRTKKIIFLDHHPLLTGDAQQPLPASAKIVCDPKSSSIAELLYTAFEQLDMTKMNAEIAMGLYVSVMTDTNSFRYSRTTPLAHRIAAEVVELGIDPESIYQAIYSSKEVWHLQLLGQMLQNVKVSKNGKVAWMSMTKELRTEFRASSDDTQSFLSFLLLLKDAEVVCLFREEDDGKIRASIKSKGKVIVNKIAMDLGGGGHDYAAGFSCSGTLEKTIETVIKNVDDAVDHFERFGK